MAGKTETLSGRMVMLAGRCRLTCRYFDPAGKEK